jgi:hypothetical protein
MAEGERKMAKTWLGLTCGGFRHCFKVMGLGIAVTAVKGRERESLKNVAARVAQWSNTYLIVPRLGV